jgi:uncharacterized membrane protein (UPF0127 family)
VNRLPLYACVLVLAAALGFIAWRQLEARAPQAPLPTLALTLGAHTVRAEVAQTAEQVARGLMFRDALAAGAGMLLVYPPDFEQRLCVWMKNTRMPLSVAFIDRSGRVLNIVDAQPHSEAPQCARGPARYALELPQGGFAAASVAAGSQLRGLPP